MSTPSASLKLPQVAPTADAALDAALRRKLDNKTKPIGSLGKLESLALQIGLIQRNTTPVSYTHLAVYKRQRKCLEHRFSLVMGIGAFYVVNVQRDASVVHKALEKFERQVRVECPDHACRERHMHVQAWTTRKSDHHA